MNVVPLQVFVSLLLVAGSIVLFLFTVRQRDLDHADRLSLAPLEDDATATPTASPAPASSPVAQSMPVSAPVRTGDTSKRSPQ